MDHDNDSGKLKWKKMKKNLNHPLKKLESAIQFQVTTPLGHKVGRVLFIHFTAAAHLARSGHSNLACIIVLITEPAAAALSSTICGPMVDYPSIRAEQKSIGRSDCSRMNCSVSLLLLLRADPMVQFNMLSPIHLLLLLASSSWSSSLSLG